MKKTKILALLLALVMCLSLAACGKTAEPTTAAEDTQASDAAQQTAAEPAAEETAQPDEASSQQAPAVETAPVQDAAPAEAAPSQEAAAVPAQPESYMASLGILNDAAAAAMAQANGIVPTTEYFPLSETREVSLWYSYPPFMDADMNKRLVFQEFEAATNVHLNFSASSLMSATSEFQLMIASGDYPDVFYELSTHYKDYEIAIDEEVIYDLNGIVQEYCPSYNYLLETFPAYKEGITGEGGEYVEFTSFTTSTSSAPESMYIRQDWLDEQGLQAPVTYDALHDVLAAFRDVYGCESALWIHEDAMTHCMMAGFGITEGYSVKDGKAQSLYNSDGLREYLTLLHQWVQEGLVCNDFFAIDTNSDYPSDSYILDGGCGVFHMPLNTASRFFGEAGDADKVYVSPICNPRKNADDVLTLGGLDDDAEVSVTTGLGFSISTCCEDIETTARWLDYWYTEAGSMTANYGAENVTYTYGDDGLPYWTELITQNPDGLGVNDALAVYCQFNGGGYFVDEWKTLQTQDLNLIASINLAHANENADDAWPSGANLSLAESEIEVQYATDIETAFAEWSLGFIVGNKNLDTQWEEYLNVLDTLHFQDVLDCYQAALDRYNASIQA